MNLTLYETLGAAKCLESPSMLMSIESPESNYLSLLSICSTVHSLLISFSFSWCLSSFFQIQQTASIADRRITHYGYTASDKSRSLPKAAPIPQGSVLIKEPRKESQKWLSSPSTDCVGPKVHSAKDKRQSPHTLFQPTGANQHLSALHHGSQASPTTARLSSAQSPAASLISHPR